ncbi:hypothetical protein METBIDRAFT_29550, partial [Metschnikowia bicuspidata var. bicuspidata NRRL YB-4993]
ESAQAVWTSLLRLVQTHQSVARKCDLGLEVPAVCGIHLAGTISDDRVSGLCWQILPSLPA